MFWSSTYFDWYKKYNDIVFDTTQKVNSYEMTFRIFVGMNSHGKSILLGEVQYRKWEFFPFMGKLNHNHGFITFLIE